MLQEILTDIELNFDYQGRREMLQENLRQMLTFKLEGLVAR